jgi:hypothetical protein
VACSFVFVSTVKNGSVMYCYPRNTESDPIVLTNKGCDSCFHQLRQNSSCCIMLASIQMSLYLFDNFEDIGIKKDDFLSQE